MLLCVCAFVNHSPLPPQIRHKIEYCIKTKLPVNRNFRRDSRNQNFCPTYFALSRNLAEIASSRAKPLAHESPRQTEAFYQREPEKKKQHGLVRRSLSKFHGPNSNGSNHIPRMAGKLVGHFVLSSERFHPRVHHGTSEGDQVDAGIQEIGGQGHRVILQHRRFSPEVDRGHQGVRRYERQRGLPVPHNRRRDQEPGERSGDVGPRGNRQSWHPVDGAGSFHNRPVEEDAALHLVPGHDREEFRRDHPSDRVPAADGQAQSGYPGRLEERRQRDGPADGFLQRGEDPVPQVQNHRLTLWEVVLADHPATDGSLRCYTFKVSPSPSITDVDRKETSTSTSTTVRETDRERERCYFSNNLISI